MTTIKFCENNLAQGTDDVVERLKDEAPSVRIEVEPCLGYCGECTEGPFALLNGEFIQADNAEELYDMLAEEI